MILEAELVPEFNNLRNLKEQEKRPCFSKEVKRGLCSLRAEEGRKEEDPICDCRGGKEKSPTRKLPTDGKYIFNSSVILYGLVHICPAVLGSRNSQPRNCRTVLLQFEI